jgi:hypothetical protein
MEGSKKPSSTSLPVKFLTALLLMLMAASAAQADESASTPGAKANEYYCKIQDDQPAVVCITLGAVTPIFNFPLQVSSALLSYLLRKNSSSPQKKGESFRGDLEQFRKQLEQMRSEAESLRRQTPTNLGLYSEIIKIYSVGISMYKDGIADYKVFVLN